MNASKSGGGVFIPRQLARWNTSMNDKGSSQTLPLFILILSEFVISGCSQADSIPTHSPVASTSTIEPTPTHEVLTVTGLTKTLEATSTSSGSARDITVDANGASHAKLADLAVIDANVEATGDSHVSVNPSGRLDTFAKGGLSRHVSWQSLPGDVGLG